uniref:Uncharacterized protein n=1 Tax=Arundo donax TaxID=35708 RepID=A0A0A8Y6Y6_ARUDO
MHPSIFSSPAYLRWVHCRLGSCLHSCIVVFNVRIDSVSSRLMHVLMCICWC